MSNPYDQFDEPRAIRTSVSTKTAPNPYDQFGGGVEEKKEASWWETIKAIPSVTLGTAEQTAGGLMQAAGERVPTPPGPSMFVSKLAEAALSRIKPSEKDKELAKAGETLADIGTERIKEDTPENLGFWKKAVLSGTSSTLAQVPAIAATALTRSPTPILASAGVQTGGAKYAEHRAAGEDPEGAATRTAIDVGAEVLTEYIPAKFLADAAGGPVLKTIIGTYKREIPTELLTTAIQSANAQFRDKEKKGKPLSWEEYGKDLLDTLGTVIVSAPLTAGVAKGASALSNLGRKEPGEVSPPPGPPADELPEVFLPPGETGTLKKDGAVNAPLTEPSFDEPTILPDSLTKEQIHQQFHAIDPDSVDQAQLDEARLILEEHQKAKDRPAIPEAELSWTALSAAPKAVDVGELGASSRQSTNAQNYSNPNTEDRLDRQFSFATDPEAIGVTPRQVMPKPGVYVLGKPSIDRPEPMLKAMMETTDQWRQRWMPNSTIILSNEQLLSNSALGWHYSMGDNKHLIVPAVLRKLSDPSKFNVNTLAGAFYNLSHEFGHALVKERFFEGASPDAMVLVSNESKHGTVSQSTLALLPEIQRRVVEEYNAIRQRIVDGSMTAEEFVKVWLGPAKLGRDFLGDLKVAPNAPAIQVGRALAQRVSENSTIQNEIDAEQFREKMLQDIFSIDEYLAEQMSRYAYSKKLDETSALGKFLQAGLQSLRKFFAQIKGEGIVAPGTSFVEWLDGLPQISRLAEEKRHIAKSKQNAGKRKVEEKTKLEGKLAIDAAAWARRHSSGRLPRAVKKVEHQVRADTKVDFAKKARGMLNRLVADGTLVKDSSLHEEILSLIENNEKDHFLDFIREITGKTVKFEIDGQDSQKVSKLDEWRPERFRSRYFKAWFGDWEGSPKDASVVRVGAFDEVQDGSIVIRNSESSPPLVSFISRSRLQAGQIYYASTLRGSHYAESVLSETYGTTPDSSVVPVVLNIRNPYIVTDSSTESPAPTELRAQGFDGIVYRNNLEGDFSFVVFDLNQLKVVDDRSMYSSISGVSMELDVDQATPTGRGAARLLQGVGNFLNSKGPLRRALRRLVHHPEKVLQIQQLAHIYPDLVDLSFFNQTNTEYVRYGSSRRAVPDRLLQRWQRLAKRNMEKVNRVFLKEMEEGVHWFDLGKSVKDREGTQVPWYEFRMSETAKTKLKENGVDIDTETGQLMAQHILEVKNSLLDSLNEDEIVLFELLSHRYANSPKVMQAAFREVRAKVRELRKTPFFPQGRFGNMILTIEKKKTKGPGKEVIWREAFESEAKWEEAYQKALSTKEADESVRKHTLTDSEYVLMSLPIDFLDTMASELGLSPKQVETLQEIARPVKNERLLKPFDLTKRGIKGYTSDALRSYADFTWHHSNAQAKLLHGAKFNVALGNIRQKKREIERSEQADFTELRRLTQVFTAMETAKDYIMSPPNEMQTARAIVSLTYLGLNVKTALINFYGLVTVWSDMIGKHGSVKGQARMLNAAKFAAMSMKITDLNDRRKGNYLPPDIQRGMDRAIEEGVLSQSYAYHLAGAANASNLSRMPGYGYAHRGWQHSVDLAMFMFRLTELGTRRVAFVAALQEQLEKSPGAFDQAYRDAVTQVNILQNDYSAGNRVPFMRGGAFGLGPVAPLATIFMSFAQHMAFHGYGGYELGIRRKRALDVLEGKLPESANPKWFEWSYGYTARIWLLTLLMAGYEGLPGAENILDLIEVVWRKIGKKPFRQELREMVQAIDQDPVLWSRGLAHDILGFDVSRSMGFGRMIPGTDVLSRSKDQSAEELAGALALNLMGPTGGLLKFGLSAFGDDKSWSEKLQKLPGGIGNIWNSYYWSEHGVLGPNEGKITLEKGADGQMRPRDLTAVEIAGKALGFNPTIVSQNREILWNQYDLKMYFQNGRQTLKRQYWDATRENDQEAISDVKKAISEYNLNLPNEPQYRKMRITGMELQQSLQAHRRGQKAEEAGKPTDKRSRGIYEDVRESYEKP